MYNLKAVATSNFFITSVKYLIGIFLTSFQTFFVVEKFQSYLEPRMSIDYFLNYYEKHYQNVKQTTVTTNTVLESVNFVLLQ